MNLAALLGAAGLVGILGWLLIAIAKYRRDRRELLHPFHKGR